MTGRWPCSSHPGTQVPSVSLLHVVAPSLPEAGKREGGEPTGNHTSESWDVAWLLLLISNWPELSHMAHLAAWEAGKCSLQLGQPVPS